MFIVTIQIAERGPGVGDIHAFGPFDDKALAEEFGRTCDTFDLGLNAWDPSYVTSAQIVEIEAPTQANLARHFDLATWDENGNPLTDSNGNPVPVAVQEETAH